MMANYVLCLIFVVVSWIIYFVLLVYSYVNPGPNLLHEKLRFQALFNKRFIVNGTARAVRVHFQAEYHRMLNIFREHQEGRRPFRILEIGVGTGVNFGYYSPRSVVITVDNNQYYRDDLEESINNNPHLRVTRRYQTSADDMPLIHSGSIDVVVSTYTLCAVDNIDAVLREVRRILRPEGCFLFIEPVAHPEGSWERFLQKMMSPVVKTFAGYEIDRNIIANVCTNFSDVQLDCFNIASDLCFRPHVRGTAMNRE